MSNLASENGPRTQGRFVILGYGRTGSTYLVKELNRCGAIRAYGEIFHPRPEARPLLDGQSYRDGDDSLAFLQAHVFRPHEPPVVTTGFKLFHYHLRGPGPASRLWTDLQQDDKLDVVLLGRRNVFAAFVSTERARLTRIWHPKPGDETYVAPVSIELNLTALENFMKRTLTYDQAGAAFAQGHRTTTVFYEDLKADAPGVMATLVPFLAGQVVHPPTRPFLEGSAEKSRTLISNLTAARQILSRLGVGWMADVYAQGPE